MTIKKLTTAMAGAALVLSSFAPAAFASDALNISGNGSWSQNSITADSSNTMVVSQSNDTVVSNEVTVSNDTGGNNASGNTGGNVMLHSGDANATVHISNDTGSNVASVGSLCGCEVGSTNVSLNGNGSGSSNAVDVSNNTFSLLEQHNSADLSNQIAIDMATGHNTVSDTTDGSSMWDNSFPEWMQNHDQTWWNNHWQDFNNATVQSGQANASVMIHNMGSDNIAH